MSIPLKSSPLSSISLIGNILGHQRPNAIHLLLGGRHGRGASGVKRPRSRTASWGGDRQL